MTAARAPFVLETPRLRLRASHAALAEVVADFYVRNRQAHAPWNPPMGDAVFTAAGQRQQLADTALTVATGGSVAWWLFAPGDGGPALGQIHLSQITRRAFCNAMLGYSIDTAHQGQGLMHEALQAVLADAFGPRLGLHRIQANVRPENLRSLALLERLGFEREGLAREYLFIDGAWRDHVMTALRNPDWPAGQAPTT